MTTTTYPGSIVRNMVGSNNNWAADVIVGETFTYRLVAVFERGTHRVYLNQGKKRVAELTADHMIAVDDIAAWAQNKARELFDNEGV